MQLPVADPWYVTQRLDARSFLITEPHVHPIFSANMYLVLGRDTDLLIDSGMGIAPLRPVVDSLRPERDKPIWCLSTHTHVDHIGAAHEFDMQLVHAAEAESLARPAPYTLLSRNIPPALATIFENAGYPVLWEALVDAVPHAGYDLGDYSLRGAAPTRLLAEGDVVDLGDWQAEVLHLPGHSAGQIGLWHGESGTLFGADAIYDGPLIYDAPGMSVDDYSRSLQKLRDLPVAIVHGGHDPAFGRARMLEIIDHYLALWGKD
jgi:glyoxylase-like metal-dependent hydrolase (beta-lactamase superfamily II)